MSFSDILGQERAIAALRNAIEADRLPHALIFAGPTGVGRALTASALATVFLCHSAKGSKACGKCESCRGMSHDMHPDFRRVYRQLIRQIPEHKESVARDLSIHVVRHFLNQPAGMKSSLGRGRVFVVDEAELMNEQAQNALLKTLEEPPARVMIILLATNSDELLPTVRSRSRIVRFSPLPPDIIERELARAGANKTDAASAARLSQGSLGVAKRWLADGVVERGVELHRMMQEALSGRMPSDLPDFLKKSAEGIAESMLKLDEEGSKDQYTREGLCTYLRIASQVFHARLSETSDPEALERLAQAIDVLAEAEGHIGANVTVALVLQNVSAQLEGLFSPGEVLRVPSRR